jgi:hypothetical protein
MIKVKFISLLLSVIIVVSLLNAGLTFAQSDYTVFGSKQYDKPKGSPVTYTDTFQGYEGISYTLWVQSGQDRLNEVKNVSININGTEVLDSSDLRSSNPATKTISLQSSNTLKVILKGQGGNFITVKITAPTVNISITSPSDGETISNSETSVSGTVINLAGNETGVTVNGITANVYGDQFVANNISLTEGSNTLTATATDTVDNTVTASIAVNASTTGSYVKLSSSIESGISPLTTNFSVSTSNFTPASYQMDYEGDGVVDYTGSAFDNISYTYNTEGIYYPKVTVTDNSGNSYSDSTAIAVLSKTEMDTLLKNKWEGMKEALSNGSVETAVAYFDESTKEKYRKVFETLISYLSEIASNMQSIIMDHIRQDISEYRINRMENIDGQSKEITYFIYFVKDRYGLWKIEGF